MTASHPSNASAAFASTLIREFAAPREQVFQAWTDPAQLAQWWGPEGFTNPVCEWDARPGGKIYIVMRGPDGTDYPMTGEFREVVSPERLVFISGPLDREGKLMCELLHTVTFVEHAGVTTVTVGARALFVTDAGTRCLGGYHAGMSQSLVRLTGCLAPGGGPRTLVFERTFAASVPQVWQAITQPTAMQEWYFDIPDFRAETGREFQFTVEHAGFRYGHQCKITTVIPEQKLAYTWRYEGHAGNSLVTFELFAEGPKTRLRLTHEGLDTFPPLPSFARKNFYNGWTSLLGDGLKTYVENGPAAGRELIITRDFAAPRELVWEAWTRPEHIIHWYGPQGFTNTIEVMDVRPGGEWKHIMRGPDGAEYPNYSVFDEVVKPERIVFTHGGRRPGGPAADFQATWTFEAIAPGQTRVTIRMVFPSADARDLVVREYGAVEGARQTLERLGTLLASGRVAVPAR